MDEERNTRVSRGSWELFSAPSDAVVKGSRYVYTLKYNPNDSVDLYKARLIVKVKLRPMVWVTLRLVARLNSIQILFSIVVNLSWPFFQLNVKNVFLYGD